MLKQVQGIEFSLAYQFLQVVENTPQREWPPYDLTGYTWRFRATAFNSTTVAIELTSASGAITVDLTTGIVTCTIPATDTPDLLGKYADQLIGTPASGSPDIAVDGEGIYFEVQL